MAKKDLVKSVEKQTDEDLLLQDKPRKVKQVFVYEDDDDSNSGSETGGAVIEAPKEVPKPRRKLNLTEEEKQRRGQRLKDYNATKRKELDLKRKQEREQQQEEIKKQREEKIIQKAIALKKKELKKQAILDEISDDDEDIEVIKRIVAKKKQKEQQKESKPQPATPVAPAITQPKYIYI